MLPQLFSCGLPWSLIVNFWTIPNCLTYFRILLIPAFVILGFCSFLHHEWATAFIFFIGAVTDWLDGFLARYLHQGSAFGEFLDPVADKLVVAAALVLLITEFPNPWMAIPGVIIISREILISALREWMAELGKRTRVKVSYIGKIKTSMQMLAILILLTQKPAMTPTLNPVIIIGFICLYIAVILTIWSMCIYLIAAWKVLRHLPAEPLKKP